MAWKMRDPEAPCTPNQRLGVYKWVRDRSVFDPNLRMTKQQASDLMSAFADWRYKRISGTELEKKVNAYLPGWKVNGKNGVQLDLEEKAPEPEPEPEKLPEPEPTPEPQTQGYIKPDCWDPIYRLVKSHVSVLLYGPAGTGKSRLFEELAGALDLEFFCMSFSGGLRKSDVFWSTQILDGETVTQLSPLLEAVQRPCLVLLDELVMAEPDLAGGLNSLLEPHSRSIQTPIGRVSLHPECLDLGRP